MTKEELFDFIEDFYEDNITTLKNKNADYSGGNNDPFGNFKSVEAFGIPAEVGFITRMADKMARISSFVIKGEQKVKDESVTDTLKDLSNYSALLAAYIKQKHHDTL